MMFVTMGNVLFLTAAQAQDAPHEAPAPVRALALGDHDDIIHVSTLEKCRDDMQDDVYCRDGKRECLKGIWMKNGGNCEGEHAVYEQKSEVPIIHAGEKTPCRSNAQCGLDSSGDPKARNKSFLCLHAERGDDGVYRYNYRCNDPKVPEGSACFCQKIVQGEVVHWAYKPVTKSKNDVPNQAAGESHSSTLGAIIPNMIIGFSFMMM